MTLSLIMMFVGGIILLGFFSSELFDRTKIPDSLVLIAVGLAIQRFGILDPAAIQPLTPVVASIAIATILFDAGIKTNISELLESFSSAFNMANITFAFNTLAISAISFLLMGWDPLTSLMVGFILGGTSAAVAIPLSTKILPQESSIILELESTITNIYNLIFSLSVATLIQTTTISPNYAIRNLLAYFSIGVFLGLLGGIMWLGMSKRLWGKPFSYMATFAFLFIIYGVAEYSGGSGAIAGLVFGLVLGNNKGLSEIIKTPAIGTSRFAKFSQELSFLVRTYFFLFLGVILSIPRSAQMWTFALVVAVSVMLVRLAAASLLNLPQKLALMIHRGLSEAVIASLIVSMGLPNAQEIITAVGLTIIVTNILPSVVMIGQSHHNHRPKPVKN